MISLCAIVKNEGVSLGRMLASVKPIVSEIIVIDTGSSDDSAHVAQQHGARVISHPWQNDFAEARNFSLSHATKPWILVLDADEELAPTSVDLMKSLISGDPRGLSLNRRHFCLATSPIAHELVTQADYGYERGARAYFTTHDIRLFPNNPALRYTGAVHESVEDSIRACGYPIERTDVLIYHFGHLNSEEKKKDKATLYLELAKRKADCSPHDWRTWHHLGIELQSQSLHFEAIESFEKAVALIKDYSPLWREYAISLHAVGREVESLEAFATSLRLDSTSTLTWIALGATFVDLGNLPEAEHCFKTILASDPGNTVAQNGLGLIAKRRVGG